MLSTSLSRRAEIFIKVIAWRIISVTLSFFVIYHFTGSVATTTRALAIGTIIGIVSQWLFEMTWDTFIRSRLRYALSGQQCRIDRLLRWRRSTRDVSVDQHESGSDGIQENKDPLSPENAGREWTWDITTHIHLIPIRGGDCVVCLQIRWSYKWKGFLHRKGAREQIKGSLVSCNDMGKKRQADKLRFS